MRIIFMGTPDFAVGTFEALLEAGATRFGTSKGIRIIKGE